MKLTATTSWLDVLSPAGKMELADRLYDMAAQELEQAERSTSRRREREASAAVEGAHPVIEPWQGFCDRLSHR